MTASNRKIFDLTVPWGRNLPTYAMSLNFYNPPMYATYSNYSTTVFEKVYDRGETMYDTMIAFFPHTGTHLDAPLHCNKTGWAVNEIPLDYLWGEGVVVGIPKGELGEITPDDLEKASPKIQKGDILIVNTGWHKNFCGPMTDWNKAVYYAHKNPGIKQAGVKWCIDRGIKILGVDYIGVDHPGVTERGDGSWPAHKGLLGANIPMLQVLGGELDAVTGKRCQICFAPVPYVGGDGFPVRVLAKID